MEVPQYSAETGMAASPFITGLAGHVQFSMRAETSVRTGLVVVAMTLVMSGLFASAGQSAPPPQVSDVMPDGPGKAVTLKVCAGCHDVRVVASLRLTRDAWAGVVSDMVQRGAKGTDEEVAQVLEYLAGHFLGEAPRPINVNTAPAIDLESVVGLLRSEARALIAYREKTPCKVINDLKNVPGIDFKKIEAARDRIVCV
jgi:mono/diheme cytochrome c family protein